MQLLHAYWLERFGGTDARYRSPYLIVDGEIFDGRRVFTGSQQRAGEDAGTRRHWSVLAQARSDGATGAGHFAGGGLQLAPAGEGLMLGFRRRSPSAERSAVGIDVTESTANCHHTLP